MLNRVFGTLAGLVCLAASGDTGGIATAKKRNATAKKATKKATKKAKSASGEKPATAIDRAEAGDGKAIGKIPVPTHLRSKVGKPDGETFGRTTGLRVVHFADALLRHNEKAKETDANLNATLVAEFPKRHSKASGVQGQKTLQTVAAFRSYHNAGKHGCDGGLGDGHRSHSYNAEGEAREVGKPAKKAKAKKAKK